MDNLKINTVQDKADTGFVQTGTGSYVNPAFISDAGLTQARNFSGLPSSTPLDAAALNDVSPLSIPSSPQTSSAVANINGVAQTQLASGMDSLKQQADMEVVNAKNTKNESASSLKDLMSKYLGVQNSQQALEDEAGIEKKGETYRKSLDRLDAVNNSEANELRALDSSNMTDAGKQSAARDISRKYAFQRQAESFNLSVAQRDYTGAQEAVDRRIKLQLEPLKSQIEFQTTFYEDNKENLSNKEKQAFELKITENTRKYEQEKSTLDTIGKLQMKAAEQGAPQSVIDAIGNSKTVGDAASAAGVYGGDILARQKAQLEIQKLQNELKGSKILSPQSVSNEVAPTNGDKNTVSLVSILGNSKVGQGTKTNIANILGVTNALSTLANERQDGKFEGFNPAQGVADFIFPEAMLSKQSTENRGYLDAVNLKVQQWASGASLTAQQIAQVNNLTPKKSDTDEKVRTKINNLSNFMLTQAQSQLQSEGIQYQPLKVNLFETYDMLSSASPEQIQQLKDEGLLK